MTDTIDSISTRPKRPFTLKAISGLLLLRAGLIAVEVTLLSGLILTSDTEPAPTELALTELAFLGLPLVALGVLNLVLAVGIWQLRPWAWRLTIITTGGLILNDLWHYLGGERDLTTNIALVLNMLIIFYLAQADVRRLFEASLPGDSKTAAPETAPPSHP